MKKIIEIILVTLSLNCFSQSATENNFTRLTKIKSLDSAAKKTEEPANSIPFEPQGAITNASTNKFPKNTFTNSSQGLNSGSITSTRTTSINSLTKLIKNTLLTAIQKKNTSNTLTKAESKEVSKNLFANPSKSITPELEELVDKITKPKLPFVFSGYLDAYYFKNLNNPKNSSNTGLSGAARAFDQKENQFQIGLAQTKFNWNKKKVEATIDLVFGPHADLANHGNKVGPLGVNVGSSALSVKQAFITYKVNSKNAFTMGQFGTHIGYEVIESSLNYHYSLSNLFNNGPFYHQGLKFTHTFNEKLAVMAGVVNNWDNLYDNNRFKTAVAQISMTPKTGYNFSLNYIGGNEDDITDSTQTLNFYEKQSHTSFKQLLDFTANMLVTKKLNIGINAAFGSKSNQLAGSDTALKTRKFKTWGGISAYITYSFSPQVSFGIRAEFFDNSSGVQYIGKTDVQSYTATFNIKLDDDLFLKPECRMDTYKWNRSQNGIPAMQEFMDKSGHFTKNSQVTVGLAVIYKF